MTHPDGGSGTGPSGPAGPSPREQSAYDRGTAHMGALFDGVMSALGPAIASPRSVAQVNAAASLADLRAAAWINQGLAPSELDRNGWPIGAGMTPFPKELAMRGNPDTNPHPSGPKPDSPPPPRLKPSPGPVDTDDPQPAGPPPPVA